MNVPELYKGCSAHLERTEDLVEWFTEWADEITKYLINTKKKPTLPPLDQNLHNSINYLRRLLDDNADPGNTKEGVLTLAEVDSISQLIQFALENTKPTEGPQV